MKLPRIYICLLLLLSGCQRPEDLTVRPKIKKYSEPGGVEYILESYDLGKNSKYSPYFPCLDCKLKATKLEKGKLVYSVVYQIDENGFRKTAHSDLPGKTKHFFLIDGSFAFSEGLKDEHSLIDKINVKSKIVNAYDVGFLGHGPQHNWLAFKRNILKKIVKEKSGSAVLITQDQDMKRLWGTPDHLVYSSEFPNLVETAPGEFEYKGTFKDSGTWMQKLLIRACVPFLFCRTQLTKLFSQPDEEQIAKSARLFDSIEKMYREQFQAESFTILWTGSDSVLEKFKKYSHSKIVKIEYERFDVSHPTAKGVEHVVDLLFEEKLLN